MTKPTILMTGSYTEWDMPVMEQDYTLLKLGEADDRDAFVSRHAQKVRAVATRGDLGASAQLIAALQSRRINAAGLDVFLNEPNIDRRFLALDNAVLQPHHGSGTVETRKAMGQLVRDNLAAHFAGRPLLTPVV